MNQNDHESQAWSQGGYMKSAEFAAARGVSAIITSLRARTLITPAKRDFLWWLQGISLQDGGFRRLARELVEMFPERLATDQMVKAGVTAEMDCPADLVSEVECDFSLRFSPKGKAYAAFMSVFAAEEEQQTIPEEPPRKGAYLIGLCRDAALDIGPRNEGRPLPLDEFLTRLCITPQWQFNLPGEDSEVPEIERERAIEQNPELCDGRFSRASVCYFRDIIGALVEYRTRIERQIRDKFYLTAIGKKVWAALDFALASKKMVLIDGEPGRGKSEAVKAWCRLHGGCARFVNLKGVATKTAMFGAIARALGITHAYNRTAPELQSKIEDVLTRSKIMLVIDEAHFAFNQTRHMAARPELIDWIDTALCNDDIHNPGRIPVALVTTPQFFECLARAKSQVGWNYVQFQRRLKMISLPKQNTEADIFGAARNVFKDSCEAAIKKAVGYALFCKRDLSAIGDIAKEIRAAGELAEDAPLSKVPLEAIQTAINSLLECDSSFKAALDAAEAKQHKSRHHLAATPTANPADEFEPQTEAESIRPSDTIPAASEDSAPPIRTPGRIIRPAAEPKIPAANRRGVGDVLTTH